MAREHRSPAMTMRKALLITCLIYVLIVVLHLGLSVFTKTIDVLPDELRYLETARSLAANGSLFIRGDISEFQKILYPALLLPAMLFSDAQQQIEAITVLNCIYACSLVFPVFLMAKRLFRSPWLVLVMVTLAAAFPEICYSATFMSENVYVPLALWCIAALWRVLDHPMRYSIIRFSLCGMLCHAAYLCKEVGGCFLLATLILMLAKLRGIEREDKLNLLVKLAAFLFGFCLPFLMLKLTLFQGMGNSYDQTSLDVLQSVYSVLFGFLALGANYTYLLIGFCIVPLLLPLLTYQTMRPSEKTLANLVYLCLAICFITVVYSISIREDAGNDVIRQHLRYLSCFLLPLVMLMTKAIMEGGRITCHRTPRRFAASICVIALSAFAILVFYGLGDLSQGFDTGLLHLHRVIAEADGTLPVSYVYAGKLHVLSSSAEETGLHSINWIIWLAKSVLALLTIGLMALCLFSSRSAAMKISLSFVFLAFVANSLCCSEYNYKAYHVEDSYVEATEDLSERLKALPDDSVVALVYDEDSTLTNNLLDTYGVSHCRENMVYTNIAVIKADTTQGAKLDMDLLTEFGIAGNDRNNAHRIDYLVFNGRQGYSVFGEGAKPIELGYSNLYELYQVEKGKPIYIEKEPEGK